MNRPKRKPPLWETILEDDIASQNRTREASFTQMRYFWEAMKSSGEHYNPMDRSNSGLVGGDGEKVRLASGQGILFGGDFFNDVIAEALRVSECNGLHETYRRHADGRFLRRHPGRFASARP